MRTKEDGTMNSSALQNPSDPDATYRNKAGKQYRGYSANIEETVGKNGSVVTDYQYDKNTHTDSQFLQESLSAMEKSEEEIIVLVVLIRNNAVRRFTKRPLQLSLQKKCI